MVAVVLILLLAGAIVYVVDFDPGRSPGKPSAPEEAVGFTQGHVVTFVYSAPFNCTPNLTTFYAGESSAANASGGCEIGDANQGAVPAQIPEWILVPAFAGMTTFGLTSMGASSDGFPQFDGSVLLTGCGAGGTVGACPDHPHELYSPDFTAAEQHLGITTGTEGLPEGVLPTPAHDLLLDTATTYPNVAWGSIVVFVFDPNIFPKRSNGDCTQVVPSNLSSPTADCLTSFTALATAFGTNTNATANANTTLGGNALFEALGEPSAQVVVVGASGLSDLMNLNANLYTPFSVQPGLPSTSLPT
ncbi:MAG: hypothetical protein WBG19_08280 [Thermoplasmata archaeon]